MFQTGLLSIIRSLSTVYTATGICHASYVDCLLARSGWNSLAFIIRVYHDARSSECQIQKIMFVRQYIPYYFTSYFLWHVSILFEPRSGSYNSRDYTVHMSICRINEECKLCNPRSTRYCGTRHRLASSTEILLLIITALIIRKLKSNELVFDNFYTIVRCIQKNFIVLAFDHPWIVVNPYYVGVTPVTVEYQVNTLLEFNNLWIKIHRTFKIQY